MNNKSLDNSKDANLTPIKIILISNGKIGTLIKNLIRRIKDIEIVAHVTEGGNGEEDSLTYLFDYENDKNYHFLDGFQFDFVLVYSWKYKFHSSIVKKYTFYNLHPSLLPKYRGALPIVFQLLNDERTSGVTLYQIDEGFDTGPIYKQESFEISPEDNYFSVSAKVIKAIKKLLIDFVESQRTASLETYVQDDLCSSYYGFNDLRRIIISSMTSYSELQKISRAFGDLPLNFEIDGNVKKVLRFSKIREDENQVPFNLPDKSIYLWCE